MKELLVKLGLSEENAQKFMDEAVTNKYVPISRLNEVIAERDNFKKASGDYEKQLEDLKGKVGESEELQKTIEGLQSENKASKEKFENELKALKINSLAESELLQSGAINAKITKAAFGDFLVTAQIDNEKIVGFGDKIKEIKAMDEYRHLFKSEEIVKSKVKGGFEPASGAEPKDKSENNAGISYEKAIENVIATQIKGE